NHLSSRKSLLAKCLIDVAIRRDRGRGAVAGGCNRLGRGVLANIADGIKPVTGSFHRSVRRHMPATAKLDDTLQKLRVGMQADVNEQAGEINLRYFSRIQIANPHAG